jgi:transposase
MSSETNISHEPVDDVPVIIAWLLGMHVDKLIDQILPEPHGNWQGLSYGQVTVIWLSFILSQADHRMCPVEEWVRDRAVNLRRCTEWEVRPSDLTDDRLEIVLDRLGDEQARAGERLDEELGKHVLQAYHLPTKIGRIDTTTFSVCHGETDPNGEKYQLLKFGKSKDRRPDLRQFVQALGTLDPAGIPLVSAMLRGSQNDSPVYLPLWRRMVEIVGHTQFLLVGDSKLSSLGNRVQLHLENGWYLSPLAMTGRWPGILREWVLDPPFEVQDIYLPDQDQTQGPAYRGFVMELGTLAKHPQTGERVGWMEQVFVVCNTRTARRQIHELHTRLRRAEQALDKLIRRPGSEADKLRQRAQAVLVKYKVQDYLQVSVQEHITYEERWQGAGRPGPNRSRQMVAACTLRLTATRQMEAIKQAERLAGWRLYVSNVAPQAMSLQQSIDYYRDEWQPERGFHRWKRGGLPALPIYLKYESRIRGLMVLLSIGLRVLTLVEFVVRRQLDRLQTQVAGLYEGNPKRATDRPTTERLFRAFKGIVLYRSQTGAHVSYQLTPLSDLQKQILDLMLLPADLYSRLLSDIKFVDTG